MYIIGGMELVPKTQILCSEENSQLSVIETPVTLVAIMYNLMVIILMDLTGISL